MKRTTLLQLLIVLSTVPGSLVAQGRTDYLNVESPQVHPIEVVTVGGHDFVVACNTRNNTIEIFDTDESQPERLVSVVRVGLEPVTVRFHAASSRLFTANFLGDSVSAIKLTAPAGPGTLAARLEQTTWVGDEPLDIAFFTYDAPGGPRETLFVSHMALDGLSWHDAETLQAVEGKAMEPALVDVGFETSDPPDGIPDELVPLAAKEPWSLAVHDGKLFALALKGGSNSLGSLNFDLDYYCDDLATPFSGAVHVGGLGTTGLSMTFDSSGNLIVVGAEALNESLKDEPVVMRAPTGFVKSMVYVVQDPCGDNPVVMARDVNEKLAGVPRSYTLVRGGVADGGTHHLEQLPGIPHEAVSKDVALSMLTDVTVFESGGTTKVFFSAFGNDRLGVLEPNLKQVDTHAWPRRSIDIPTVNGNPLAGPNGLALRRANPDADDDTGPRLYVLNHLDSSIVTIDPVTETLVPGGGMSLSHDPRPDYLTVGQQFLYDANLSGNGFTSCASCHVHGRTDRRVWDLGDPAGGTPPIPAILPDGLNATEFPADKGNMMTQSLQGLLNYEIDPASLFWVTNAPYHWRGDRASFVDFNGAFASLLGGDLLDDEEMKQFEAFVNSIHYPPNPKQPFSRVPSGDFGVGEDLTTDGSSGAARGQKMFHIATADGRGSCNSGCHSGTEGSNNRQTEAGPIEVAALRGLYQKEAKRDVDGSSDPFDSPYTGVEGLTHTGLVLNNQTFPQFDPLREFNLTASINAFNKLFFSGRFCAEIGDFCPDLQAVNQYTHEFDWGIGPLVGCPVTVKPQNVHEADPLQIPTSGIAACDQACASVTATLACMEQQAGLANSGVAVQAWIGDADRGFWYDAIEGTYHEEPAGGQTLTRSALVNLIAGAGDRLVFQAVPLGNERRVAAPDGRASPLAAVDAPPESLRLLPMVANTFNERVPELTNLWADLDNSGVESIFVHTVRLYQWGLILEAGGSQGFGVGDALRHEVPRRLQVSGDNIRHGATLVLGHFNGPSGPPDPEGPLEQGPLALIGFPIYPTGRTDDDGRPIWQTAIELEPLMYLGLMLGGPFAPGVAPAYVDQKPFSFQMAPGNEHLDQPAPGEFAPEQWNWIYVSVINTDLTTGEGGWQRLTVE